MNYEEFTDFTNYSDDVLILLISKGMTAALLKEAKRSGKRVGSTARKIGRWMTELRGSSGS